MRTISVMQGRLSPPRDGLIQSFPADTWEDEFTIAASIGLDGIEWTVDLDGYSRHPLIDRDSQGTVTNVLATTGLRANAVTCDFFMQADVYGQPIPDFSTVEAILRDLIGTSVLGDALLVVPLVDFGRPRTLDQWNSTRAFFCGLDRELERRSTVVAFELDIDPRSQRRFVESLGSSRFGINYDMGNSAAQGYEADDELAQLADAVLNVHVKDRMLGGSTVPLGHGSVDFPMVQRMLDDIGYDGNLTLQVARGDSGREADAVAAYVAFCRGAGLL